MVFDKKSEKGDHFKILVFVDRLSQIERGIRYRDGNLGKLEHCLSVYAEIMDR